MKSVILINCIERTEKVNPLLLPSEMKFRTYEDGLSYQTIAKFPADLRDPFDTLLGK